MLRPDEINTKPRVQNRHTSPKTSSYRFLISQLFTSPADFFFFQGCTRPSFKKNQRALKQLGLLHRHLERHCWRKHWRKAFGADLRSSSSPAAATGRYRLSETPLAVDEPSLLAVVTPKTRWPVAPPSLDDGRSGFGHKLPREVTALPLTWQSSHLNARDCCRGNFPQW